MNNKVSFSNTLIAFVLSVIIIVITFPALFSIPLELVVMNSNSYSGILDQNKVIESARDGISDTIIKQIQIVEEGEVFPNIFSNEEALSGIFNDLIPDQWIVDRLNEASVQVLEYLNFKVPFGVAKLDLTFLKEIIKSEASNISEKLLSSYPSCDPNTVSRILGSDSLGIVNLPACNPSTKYSPNVLNIMTKSIEGFVYSIPEEYIFGFENVVMNAFGDELFTYSIYRWAFRLLPIILLILFVFVALLLKNNWKKMRGWVGRLLVISSTISLIITLILAIGSEQLSAVAINKSVPFSASNFGTMLLVLLQSIVFRSLLWIGAMSAGIFLLGLVLLLINNGLSTKKEEVKADSKDDYEYEDILEAKKEIFPEADSEELESE